MNKKQRLEARITERQKYWAEKRPNWKKEPIARVQSPLSFIEEKAVRHEQNAKGQWVKRLEPFYQVAAELARTGQGAKLQAMARNLYYTA